ncbi:MAG TPA: hypothetical protein VIK93_07140 [Limnochordales bacterium]
MTVAMTGMHRGRFGAAMDAFRQAQGKEPDRRWRVLLLLLTASAGLWERAQPHIDWERASVDLTAIAARTPDEERLLQVAANLFHGHGSVDVADLADRLDGALWRVVLLALDEYHKRR